MDLLGIKLLGKHWRNWLSRNSSELPGVGGGGLPLRQCLWVNRLTGSKAIRRWVCSRPSLCRQFSAFGGTYSNLPIFRRVDIDGLAGHQQPVDATTLKPDGSVSD